MKRITIKDVAARAGVSIATVSAVINGRDSVREATRSRVQEAVDALHYRPVEAARRRLKTPGTRTIGLVIKEVENPFFADIILGAQEEARRNGFQLLIASSAHSIPMEIEAVEALAGLDIDGLIINPLLDEDGDLSHLLALLDRNIPLVLLEGLGRVVPTAIVDVDSVQGARDATTHLFEHGHRRIVHLGGPKYSMHAAERVEGVRLAFADAGQDFEPGNLVHAGAAMEDGQRATLELLGRPLPERPTAIFCYNDLVAIGAMGAAFSLGLRVPEDLSIVGYDDIRMASYLPVPLTTIRVPRRELGRQAAALIIDQVQGRADVRGHHIKMDAELVVRASTRSLDQ